MVEKSQSPRAEESFEENLKPVQMGQDRKDK